MIRLFTRIILLIALSHQLTAQSRINGRVVSASEGYAIGHVIIKVNENTSFSTFSDSAGKFSITVKQFPVVLEVSHVGFMTLSYRLDKLPSDAIEIGLVESTNELEDFVVSTGYEKIPKERMTGSFVQIDNQLFNRRVSPDILSRLEDVVPGLMFNRRAGLANISIRGRNTITGDGQPLIVVDNFPFEGDLSSLNPNDIENVSVLKDAAASSIWGARAGNGVIVITTKKGGFKQKPTVTFNTNFTSFEEPDLYYQPQMRVSDFVDWEQKLFNTGYYRSFESYPAMVGFTPLVELLISKRDGHVSESEATASIAAFRQNDVRRDMARYLYRKGQNSQYSLSLSGGDTRQKYAISLGYDKQLASLMGNDNNRITLNVNHTYRFADNKLELSTGIFYASQSHNRNSTEQLTFVGTGESQQIYPYARLADDYGNALNVVKNNRTVFAEEAARSGLYDWTYSPLNELSLSDKSSYLSETRLQSSLSYLIIPGLRAELSYLYQNSSGATKDYYNTGTYFSRNLMNTFTQVDSRGDLSLPIPYGGILDRSNRRVYGNSVRGQINFNKQMAGGQLDVIAGSEIRDHKTEVMNYRWYGYDDLYATSLPVDYTRAFVAYGNPFLSSRIPSNQVQRFLIDRYLSYYTNGSYRWKEKYILSGSARLDQSNLFGVKANQKGVPLWSAGLAWVISEEGFLKDSRLSYLKLRLTYGSSGNVNKTLSAQTTATFSPMDNFSLLPYATIQNPPNPFLQWEKVKMLNIGVDFDAFNKRLSGSMEFFTKRAYDLFGQIPYAPSTGISQFSGNTSATKGSGVDLNVNVKILEKQLQWHISTLFSYVADKVTNSKVKYPPSYFLAFGETIGYPLEGKPQFSVFSYDFAGLDSKTGDPMGYLDDEPSTDWNRIVNNSTIESLRYHGSARPVVFGALRNHFAWKQFSFSANISYRLGYYFWSKSVNYDDLWKGKPSHSDFEARWQKPGDELHTTVPSDPGRINSLRNVFYTNSSVLVQKGDHIRLQDVRISYSLPSAWIKPQAKGEIYAYLNNLGVLWKATKTPLDPDYPDSPFPPTRSIGFGLRLTL